MSHSKRFVSILFAALALTACSEPRADYIVENAVVLTMNEALPQAQAFRVQNGRISHVGTTSEIRSNAGDGIERIDMRGRTVLPGFNDAHLHPLLIPPSAVSLARESEIDAVVTALRDQGRANPEAPWILGFEYDDTQLGRHLHREDLDRVATDRPVLVWHASLHLMAVNSFALGRAGVTRDTHDPDGGSFYRDDEGDPTGLISERSALEALFNEEQPSPLIHDLDSALAGLDQFARRAHGLGITSVTDAMVPPELALTYWLWSPEEAGLRVNLMLDGEDLPMARRIVSFGDLIGLFGRNAFDNDWLRARTVKIFHGLSLSGRTARLHEPYADRPDYYGHEPQRTQEELDALVEAIHEGGFQAAVHTNGDYEIDMVLNAIERATGNTEREHRHRIEHGSIVNERILGRMRDLEIVYAPHSYIFEKGPMLEAYGEARWDWMFANASSFEFGIPNAANSDFPVAGLPPMLRIQSLVTRRSRGGKVYGARQRLSVEQALHAYTVGGAYASFEEDSKGSISPGEFADFIVLSKDPRKVPPHRLSSIRVDETWVDGRKVFDRTRESARP